MRQSGIAITSVSGRNGERTSALARSLDAASTAITEADLSADLVLLCVPESVISEVCQAVCGDRDASPSVVAHLAGGLGLSVLESAHRAGARTGKVHPIASLSGGAARLRGIVWGIDGDDEILPDLYELIERLGGIPFGLRQVNLPLYHLAAVFASNYILALLDAATQLWNLSGAPIPAGEALLPLTRGTLENCQDLGIENALTGPIARGDAAAVARQLRVVLQEAPELETIFRALGVAAAAVTDRKGAGSSPHIGEIARFLAKSEMLD